MDEHAISDALDWRKDQPTPACDAYSDPDEAPDRAIVIQEGYVIGFRDRTFPPEALAANAGQDFTYDENKGRAISKHDRDEAPHSDPTGEGGAPSQNVSHEEKGGVEPPSEDTARPVSRSLVVDFPEKVPLGDIHSLLVSLSVEAGASANLPIVLPSSPWRNCFFLSADTYI